MLPDELLQLKWLKELNLGNDNQYESNPFKVHKPIITSYSKLQHKNPRASILSGVDSNERSNNFKNANLKKLQELSNLKYLDLGNTNLKYFDFIFNLKQLSALNLASNSHIEFPYFELQENHKLNLRALDLSYIEYACEVWNWDFIKKETMEFLNIRGTRFSSWMEIGMSGFTALRAFNADHHIREMIGFDDIGQLQHLEYLDISWIDEKWYEELVDYEFIGNLIKLKHLDLTGIKKIESFDFLKRLKELEILHVSRLSLETIPISFAQLKSVKQLFLGGNRLVSCEGLEGMTTLKELELSSNKLSDLLPLKNLQSLELLHLSNNAIESAEMLKPIISLPNLKALYLYENPISDIPSTFIGNGYSFNSLEPVRSYFKSIEGGYSVRNEIKLVLAGNSTAGKTSLRKLLKNVPVDNHELTTHGIVCDTWQIPFNGKKNGSSSKK